MGARSQGCRASLGAALLAGALAPVLAQEAPGLSGEIDFELEHDWHYESDARSEELSDTFLTVEPYLRWQLTPAIALQALGVLEPVRDPGPGRDRFMEDHGLYLEHLSAEYAADRFTVYAGKFTPNFGRAWDLAPGIYGTDLAEDYELVERVGVGGAVRFGGAHAGAHALSASTFFLDTSVLSTSAFTDRGRVRGRDGGPANTGDLASFAVALDGGAMPIAPGLRYHLGYVRQAVEAPGGADEAGFVAGLLWELEDAGTLLGVGAEFATFRDLGGTRGDDADYWTGWVQLTRGPWNAALSGTRRAQDLAAGDGDDDLLQLSAGYEFSSGLTLDVGWRLGDEDGTRTRTLGALLTYTVEF